MAVKASSNITLFHVIDIDSTTIYYLLQSSTANPPAKPTTDNPGGNWTTTEPTYTEGSTNTLYTVTKTKFSDGSFEYTPVSKSTSYEAAKVAYNKAYNAESIANAAEPKIYHTCTSSGGTAGYFYFAQLKIVSTYANKPITFSVSNRGLDQTNVELRFTNANSTDPGITIFKTDNKSKLYIVKNTTSTWDLYVKKSESYDSATFTKFSLNGYENKFQWTWKDETVITLPADYIEANNSEIIVGTQTTATNVWTGVANFDSLSDKQEIIYWLPYNGNSSSATLNLTLSNGNTTGAKNVYYSGTSRVTTHYPAGNIIRMIYRENVSIAGSSTLYTGWWCDANYDSNNYDRLRYQNNIKSDQTYLGNSRIAAQGTNGLYSIITRGFSFKIDSPILYVGSTLNPVTTGNNNYLMYSGINITNNICWNCDTATEVTVNKGYSGTKITGTSTTATVFSDSGITAAVVNDIYINTSTYYLYKCTVAGNAATAKWVYVKSLYKPVGKRWYNGTKITGTDTTAKVFSGSGISSAGVGDYYYNTGTGGYYECTLAGNASTAKWKYNGLLIENYKTIYLRGTLENGIFTVDDIPMTTTIPEEDDGLYYISLGSVYSLTAYGLFPEHPMYKYVNGEFKSLNQVSYEAQSLADTVNVSINGSDGILQRLGDNDSLTAYINQIMEALEGTLIGSNTIVSENAPTDQSKIWLDSLTGHFKHYVDGNWVDILPDDVITSVKHVQADITKLQDKVIMEFKDIVDSTTGQIIKTAQDQLSEFAEGANLAAQVSYEVHQRFQFSAEGLIISSNSTNSSDSTYRLHLTNESITIKGKNDESLSWWNTKGFVSKHIECEELSLKKENVAEFKWLYNTNDSVSFRKVG